MPYLHRRVEAHVPCLSAGEAMEFIIDADHSVIRVTAGSTVTPEHVLNLREALAADPGVKPHMGVLVDLRPTSTFGITRAQLRELVETRGDARPHREGMKAALVGSVTGSFATVRIYEAASTSGRSRIGAFFGFELRDPAAAGVGRTRGFFVQGGMAGWPTRGEGRWAHVACSSTVMSGRCGR